MSQIRQSRICLSGTLLLILSVVLVPKAVAAQSEQRCFAETGKCIAGAIRMYWEQNGGLPVFGLPLTDVKTQPTGDGWEGPVQWFERDRLEDHGTGGVMAGRLGADVLFLQGHPWETLPKSAGRGDDCRFFTETGHYLCEPFLSYWLANGGIERFGFPISQSLLERNADGWAGFTQWFERRRMEYHSEGVMLGLLGTDIVNARVQPHSPTASSSRAHRVIQNGQWRLDNVCQAGPISFRFQLDANVMHIMGHSPGSEFLNIPLSIREERDDRVLVELKDDKRFGSTITLIVLNEHRLRFIIDGNEDLNLVDDTVPCRDLSL
jgi:hypothetical protein